MGIITAKQLKQKTGEIIKKVKSGERLTVTYRGKPVAIIAPPTMEETETLKGLRTFDEAWRDIEATLDKKKPKFKGWREATEWIRNRASLGAALMVVVAQKHMPFISTMATWNKDHLENIFPGIVLTPKEFLQSSDLG